MADQELVNLNKIKKLEKNVQDSIDKLYTDTQGSSPELSRTLDFMRSKMHRAIDNIVNNNVSNTGISNISSLYARVGNIQNDQSVVNSIISTFENDSMMENVMQLYSQNLYLKEADKEYEVIMKYMPKLREALETRKEAVLSADHFTKNAINIRSSSSDLSTISIDNNIQNMREKYDIDNLLDRVYSETDILGECFVYCVPYKKALKRLLDGKRAYDMGSVGGSLHESFVASYEADTNETSFNIDGEGLKFELNRGGIIDEAILERYKAHNVLSENAALSLNESRLDSTLPDNLEKKMYRVDDPRTQDGTIDSGKQTDIKSPGAVVKILDHTMVKPLYIDDVCLGYYYIETDRPMDVEQLTFSSTLGGLKPGSTARRLQENRSDADNVILKKIAMDISQHIDAKFINSNQDLTKEIYMILKYNMTRNEDGRISRVKVTFIPPEDMIHSHFQLDPKSHRGISALSRALFPAKLYSCLYISNVIAILTRGNDKRVYYVKQYADTNITAVLLNTINQIKQSNFGLRQIENMNNIMNITGRFNDYVIPESQSGDSPVRFEIMQGQDVTHPTELMNQLEEMSVNSTDVPLEVIQARNQLDFATHYTMSSSRFLRKIYNLQAKYTKICNKILTNIYDAEFECEDSVYIELPPPMYLAMMNSSQMFQSANEHVDNVMTMYMDQNAEDSELFDLAKAKVKKYFLRSFLPDEAITDIIEQARMEYARSKKTEE
jgi:hypothetical protein